MKNLTVGVLTGRAYPVIDLPGFCPHTILDIGANVGAAAVYFHLHYPDAQVICYEPSHQNIEYLVANTESIKNIHINPYGLYDKTMTVPLFDGKDTCAQRSIVRNNETHGNSESIQLVSVSEEIKRLQHDTLSIIKIDTEGCEIPILSEISKYLDTVNLIYLEYHSEMDRLEIDRLISSKFYLMDSRANNIHRGALLYVSKSLTSAYLGLVQMEIPRPTF